MWWRWWSEPMKATRQDATTYMVEGETLRCIRPGCSYVTKSPKRKQGDPCPKCIKDGVDNCGVIEPIDLRVELEAFTQNAECACEFFQMKLRGKLLHMTPEQRRKNRMRCKHILAARDEARKDENLDALLAALPDQSEQR